LPNLTETLEGFLLFRAVYEVWFRELSRLAMMATLLT